MAGFWLLVSGVGLGGSDPSHDTTITVFRFAKRGRTRYFGILILAVTLALLGA